jgi:geranylgeranyl diphosphate synthase, type II
MPQFDQWYKSFLPWFNAELQQIPLPKEPASLYEPVRHALAGRGKRIRPALCCAIAESCGLSKEKALPAALGLELVHNFSLVHDDIMDNDDMRHGLPSVVAKWDANTAIIAGDTLFALAFRYMGMMACDGYSKLYAEFATQIMAMCEGQIYDMQFEKRKAVSTDEYLKMVEQKTGALLAGSASIGAYAAGLQEDKIGLIRSYFFRIGRIFQIQDDLLELTSNPENMGKSLGSDISAAKKTYPMLIAWQRAGNEEKEAISDITSAFQKSDDGMSALRELFDKLGVWKQVTEDIQNERDEAMNLIRPFTGDLKKTLITFTEFILDRKR